MRLYRRPRLAVDRVVTSAAQGHQVGLIVRFLPRFEQANRCLVVHVVRGSTAPLAESPGALECLPARRVPASRIATLRRAAHPKRVRWAANVSRLPRRLTAGRAERAAPNLARAPLKGRPAFGARDFHALAAARPWLAALSVVAAIERAEPAGPRPRRMHHRAALRAGPRSEDGAPSSRERAHLRAEALRPPSLVDRAAVWLEFGAALLAGQHAASIAWKNRWCDVERWCCDTAIGRLGAITPERLADPIVEPPKPGEVRPRLSLFRSASRAPAR